MVFFLAIKIFKLLDENFLSAQFRVLTTLNKKPFENIVEKGENAGNQHFFLFPQCFPVLSKNPEIITGTTFILSSANALKLVESETSLFGKEVTL